MTREEIIEGLKLLEDNMVYFDELLNDKGEYIDVHELLFEAIKALEQEPKTGHWIDHQEGRWIYAKCSECETVHDTRTNYCPNCGCHMKNEVQE